MQKSTRNGIGIFLVIVIVGFFISNNQGQNSSATDNVGLTGNIVAMDPNRAMKGSPCHSMGGRVMGDCETREINIEAKQWDWSEPTITVKSGELVRIKATSKDVSHGLSIPDIGFNLRINPGRTSTGDFLAPAPGEYQYSCSVMCGAGHSNHRGKLVVL